MNRDKEEVSKSGIWSCHFLIAYVDHFDTDQYCRPRLHRRDRPVPDPAPNDCPQADHLLRPPRHQSHPLASLIRKTRLASVACTTPCHRKVATEFHPVDLDRTGEYVYQSNAWLGITNSREKRKCPSLAFDE